MTSKIKKVLNIIIKNNIHINNTEYGTKPLLKAVQILTLEDLNQIQQYKFFDKNNKIISYQKELDNIFEKIDINKNASPESMIYTFVALHRVLQDIDLQKLKDEDDI
jgi:hypothetical protein